MARQAGFGFTFVGDLVRAHREAAGISQRELAERVDVSRSSVNLVERGRTYIPGYRVLDYCEALEIDPKTLLDALRADWTCRL